MPSSYMDPLGESARLAGQGPRGLGPSLQKSWRTGPIGAVVEKAPGKPGEWAQTAASDVVTPQAKHS